MEVQNVILSPPAPTTPSRKWPIKNYIIIGAAVVVVIVAVVLGVTLSHKNTEDYTPSVIGTAGTDFPSGLSDAVKPAYWGDSLDLTCPKGEYITDIYGYKYIATMPGLAVKCSGGSSVGDKEILSKLKTSPGDIQSITSNTGSKVLFFYLPYIYEAAGITDFHYPAGISFTKLTLPLPSSGYIPTEPVPGLVGTYGGSPDIKEIGSVKLITGLKIDRGTINTYIGAPCICDQDPHDTKCTSPISTTMYCHSYPRIGKIDVYA